MSSDLVRHIWSYPEELRADWPDGSDGHTGCTQGGGMHDFTYLISRCFCLMYLSFSRYIYQQFTIYLHRFLCIHIIHLSIYPSWYLAIYVPIYLAILLSICLHIDLCLYLCLSCLYLVYRSYIYVYIDLCLSTHLCLYLCLHIYLAWLTQLSIVPHVYVCYEFVAWWYDYLSWVVYLSFHWSIHLSIHLSIHPSTHLSGAIHVSV